METKYFDLESVPECFRGITIPMPPIEIGPGIIIEMPSIEIPPIEEPKVESNVDKMVRFIDRHLDFESKLQGVPLSPVSLCDEQKITLISDVMNV